MYPEVELAKKENRRELNLSGPEIDERISKSGHLDKHIFKLNLNFLTISGCHSLTTIPEAICSLENLSTLMLFDNKIEIFPKAITGLSKLKILDLSRNCIAVIPPELHKLHLLHSLNLSNNLIEEFVDFPEETKLGTLILSNNKLKVLDLESKGFEGILELRVQHNLLESLPTGLNAMPVLKVLDLSDNQIKSIPKTLAGCVKVKELMLANNPLSDKRLLKLVIQCQTKSCMDYIKKSGADSTPNKPKKSKTSNVAVEVEQVAVQLENVELEEEKILDKIIVDKYDDKRSLKITYSPGVKDVRQFALFCIVKNCFFTHSRLKEFLQIQTKLHDSLCGKRELATIATHDLDEIKTSTIKYTARSKHEINIIPLGRMKLMTAEKFYQDLKLEAENYRKEKKRQNFTGIYKFLYMLEDKEIYTCLEDASGNVLSLPPLTNSEISKISLKTKNILIEITSSTSALICKQVMETLLEKTLSIDLCRAGEEVAPKDKYLHLAQVKVFDVEGNVKTIYPSKVDLDDFPKKIVVERN